MTWYIAAALALLAGGFIYVWRKTVTLQDSLLSTVALVTEARTELQQKVAAIPGLVTSALDAALAKYIAENPGGTDNLDGVTSGSLITALQSITDDAKNILANGDVIEIHIADAQPSTPSTAE